jgi:hypothetical protein
VSSASRSSGTHRRRLRTLLLALFLASLAVGVLLVLVLHQGSTSTPVREHAKGRSARAHRGSAAARKGRAARAQIVSALPPGAAASFARLQASLAGPIELALVPVGSVSVQAFGAERPAHGWSTTKVPVLSALLNSLGKRGLTATEQAWARAAITESSNEAILDLFGALEALKGGLFGASEAVEDELRASGDQDTVVATAPPPPGAVTRFGQTDWRPANAVLFFSALDAGCLLSPSNTDYVLGLMQEIEPSESWGLGSAGFDRVAFKGGWGPEGAAYLVRQSGIVDPQSPRAVAVAIVAYPPPGVESFGAGVDMVTSAARWLHRELRLTAHSVPKCSPATSGA